MKIIAGKWGGQPIPSSRPSEKLRPTSEKVRESVFDQLNSRFIDSWEDAAVLDLFAGTGAYGFESLSLGAGRAVFVDHHLATVKHLKKACEHFETTAKTEVLCKGALEAIRWLYQRGDRFDFVFLDPPYREDWMLAALAHLHSYPLLKKKGLVVAEHDKREALSPSQAVWKPEGARRYGDTMITFLSPLFL